MKKNFTLLSIVALGVFANAQNIEINEPFNFTGNLEGANNGWYRHSGIAGQLTVNGNKVALLSTNSMDANKGFTTVYSLSANSSVYKVEYSVDVTAVNTTNMLSAGDYFMSFATNKTTADAASAGSFVARLFVKPGSTADKFQLGISTGTSAPVSIIPTEFPVSNTDFVNAKVTYELSKDASGAIVFQKTTLTVGSESVSDTTTINVQNQLGGIVIRESSSPTATNNTGNLIIDNIVVKSYTPVLAVSNVGKSKINLVKNSIVKDAVTFGAKANVQIVNMNGQVIKSASVDNGASLDVSSLSKGVYIIKGETNGETVSQKIIKQ